MESPDNLRNIFCFFYFARVVVVIWTFPHIVDHHYPNKKFRFSKLQVMCARTEYRYIHLNVKTIHKQTIINNFQQQQLTKIYYGSARLSSLIYFHLSMVMVVLAAQMHNHAKKQ